MAEANALELSVIHILDEVNLVGYLEPSVKYSYIYLTEKGGHQVENIDVELLIEIKCRNNMDMGCMSIPTNSVER